MPRTSGRGSYSERLECSSAGTEKPRQVIPPGQSPRLLEAVQRHSHSPQSARSSIAWDRFQSISANPANPSDQGRYVNGLVRESPFMYS